MDSLRRLLLVLRTARYVTPAQIGFRGRRVLKRLWRHFRGSQAPQPVGWRMATHVPLYVGLREAGNSAAMKDAVAAAVRRRRSHRAAYLTEGPRDLSCQLRTDRPHSKIGREIKRHLDAQPGAAMFNWFIAGHELPPDHWYFREEEGGRVLGNLCHWTDFVYQMMPPENRYPIKIIPTRSEKSDCDIAVTYIFGDGSIAAITFSAKGHTFEGVKERFAAHRGNALILMDDFKNLVVEIVDKKYITSLLFRDHGHENAILSSYEMVRSKGKLNSGSIASYIWETGQLFLKTKEALEKDKVIILRPYEPSFLNNESHREVFA